VWNGSALARRPEMDVRTSAEAATEAERKAVESVLGVAAPEAERVIRGGHADRERRHLLLPALHALQDRVGWISRGGVDLLAERLSVAPAEIYGVATFYHLLATQPGPSLTVHVCDDVACLAAGAGQVIRELESAGTAFKRSPCLGHCEHGSAALVRRAGGESERIDATVAPISAEKVAGLLSGDPSPVVGTGVPAPREFKALQRAAELGPEGVLDELARSRLAGRGGAAFPTARKWEAVARSPLQPHYVVCNADESEPGTFKDRVLLERDPFAVLEAMIICGLATGGERGYIYIRDEYPLARSRVAAAIEALRSAGRLGAGFDIELRRGAGAYVCGEETALLNSVEGRRGEPRNRPPFPVQNGLFGRPTVINNVETLMAVGQVLEMGADAFAARGTEGSAGPKYFCVSGAVTRPGVFEVDFGTTLGRLIELAGGVTPGRRLRAILLGGAAGTFVGPDRLDLPLTFEATRAAGLTVGSGAVVVFDESADLAQVVLRVARFFREESCGQCVPCRVGTVRQEEALQRLLAGRPAGSRDDELKLLGEIAQVMRDASICGLGQTAANAVQSALVELGGLA
jgi:NADH-quinone oxidoreductase subunit F